MYEEDMAASTAALSLTAVGGGGNGVEDREDEAELTGLRPTVAYLLDEWMNICIAGTASDKTLHRLSVSTAPTAYDQHARHHKPLL